LAARGASVSRIGIVDRPITLERRRWERVSLRYERKSNYSFGWFGTRRPTVCGPRSGCPRVIKTKPSRRIKAAGSFCCKWINSVTQTALVHSRLYEMKGRRRPIRRPRPSLTGCPVFAKDSNVFRWWRRLPFNFDAGTRPSNLNAWFANAAPLLDSDITVTSASADRYVAVAMHAVLIAQGSDAIFPAHPLGARRQRERS
jgi:hypothetical protein